MGFLYHSNLDKEEELPVVYCLISEYEFKESCDDTWILVAVFCIVIWRVKNIELEGSNLFCLFEGAAQNTLPKFHSLPTFFILGV